MNISLKLALPALLLLAFFQNPAPRENTPAADSGGYCAQAPLHQQKLQEDPAYRQASQRLEEQLYALAQQPAQWNSPGGNSTERGPLAQHTLPVVVHIIHNGGGENISDARVTDAIQHLNDAFANVGYYNPATGVDTEIAFCLARRDPQGNATTGVNRVQSALTDLNNSTDDQAMKDLSRWDPTQYINVWVVREICSNNGCGVAGYAYLPGAHGQPYDGIVLEAAYMGSNPTASTVLVHEMGHYLGLYHTFEGGCPNGDCQQEGDRVCDTPPDNTTARPPCPADMNSCQTDEDDASANNPFRPVAQGGLGDQVDMKENYMDYSRFECYDRFTQGQKNRMLSVAETTRSSLLNSPACIDPCPVPIIVGFFADGLSVPVGTAVNFTNTSANADSYEWSIDGTPFSTATNTSYTFNAEGSFPVTLTAFSNLSNCLPADSTLTIEVFCPVMAAFDGGDATVLAGANVAFTNTSANAAAYTWLVNGTAVSNSINYTLNTTEPGLYNVCLRAEGALCESLACAYVEATAPNTGCGNNFFYVLGDRTVNETASCLIPAADGGFYLGGSRAGESLLMKFDANGNRIWQKAVPFSGDPEEVHTLLEDGQYLVGSTRTLVNDDQYCFKYDMNTEAFAWIRSIANPDHNRTYEFINIESSPNYLLIGYMRDNSAQGCDVTWGELDKNTGNLLQMQRYSLGSCESGSDAVLVDDKVYVTGRYNAAGGGQAAFRPAITEFELDGTTNWTRLYLVSTNTSARLYSNSIIEDNGTLVICGYGDLTGISTTSVIGHISKTGLDGAIEWAAIIDVPGSDSERLNMVLDQGDGYLAVGNYTPAGGSENLLLVKTDKAGNLMWARELDNGRQEVASIKGAFVRDGYAYISATTTNDSGRDILLFKVNPFGELDTECGSLEPLEVESWQLNDPFDGFFSLDAAPFNPDNSAAQILPEDVVVPAGPSCSDPCEEICDNGMDDDGDGLADCDDSDCPCFEDCGNTFVKTIGNPNTIDGATAIVSAGDGSFYIGGYLDEEAMIASVTAEGEMLWVRRFDFTDRPDHIICLYLDSEGFLVGSSFGDDGTGPFGRGATAFRYDPENDQLLWVNYFNSRGTPDQVITNPANGNFFFIGGDILTTGAGNADNANLAELDRNTGAVLWRREFNRGTSDRFFSMVPVGNVLYCLGRYTFSSNFGKMRVTLAAFTGNGNLEWSKYYLINSTQDARMYGTSLKLDNGELVAGFYGDPAGTDLNGSSTSGIMKTDLAGELQWAKTYRLTGYPSLQAAFQLVVVPDGYLLYGYAIAGDRDLVIIKTNKQGNALWAKTYGGPADDDVYYSFCKPPILQSGGNIYFVGRTGSGGSEDALLVKALADGSLNSDDCDFAREVAVTTNDWTNLFEADAGLQEQPNPNINPQLQSVQAVAASPECNILCQASPVDAIVALDSAYCNGDSLAVTLRICNEGTDTLFSALPYTFYDGNPTADPGATVLADGLTAPGPVLPGECYSTTVSVPHPQGPQIYCIANDNGTLPPVFSLETGFPPTEIIECDYTNNIDSAGYETTVPDIDLGPDTSVCENGVFRLDAGPGFASYRWQDGSIGQTYTTFETGTFWVEATTACGDVKRDTIEIRLNPVIAIALRPDTILCSGDSIRFSTPQDPDYTYQWAPSATLDCADCPAVTATPAATTTYNLVVSNSTGCVSVDSVTIIIEDCGAILDTAICFGDSLLVEGQVFHPNEMDTVQLPDGSDLLVQVAALDTFYLALELG
ncbi:MAG: PKD domain-containing protein, partial [Phaeodactylibacter sp.]|nr:PKD domain-containing protein [Phaeodactylibacter sp.]